MNYSTKAFKILISANLRSSRQNFRYMAYYISFTIDSLDTEIYTWRSWLKIVYLKLSHMNSTSASLCRFGKPSIRMDVEISYKIDPEFRLRPLPPCTHVESPVSLYIVVSNENAIRCMYMLYVCMCVLSIYLCIYVSHNRSQ